jgi:hypothetical protein
MRSPGLHLTRRTNSARKVSAGTARSTSWAVGPMPARVPPHDCLVRKQVSNGWERNTNQPLDPPNDQGYARFRSRAYLVIQNRISGVVQTVRLRSAPCDVASQRIRLAERGQSQKGDNAGILHEPPCHVPALLVAFNVTGRCSLPGGRILLAAHSNLLK